MSCKSFCNEREDRLIGDSERLALGLKIFLGAHRSLRNFADFFEFRAGKRLDANYDKIPLEGALDVAATAMTSILRGNLPKKETQRYGLFRDAFPCVRCLEARDLPDDVVYKVDIILTCLQSSSAIEKIMRQIKDVLFTLEELQSRATTSRVQTLSSLLKEIMKNIVCCGRAVEKPFLNKEAKMTLRLVNNFIRDWSEKRSQARPCLRTCRFCNRVITDTTRQWGTFCCKEAQQFNCIWEEWALQQSISDASKIDSRDDGVKLYRSSSELIADGDDKRLYLSDDASRFTLASDSGDAGSAERSKSARAIPGKLARTTEMSSARGTTATRRTKYRVSSRRADAGGSASFERDEFHGVDGRETQDRALGGKKTRGEIRSSRDIDRRYPIAADGRERRDVSSHGSEPRGIRGARDVDEEGTAVGKMRKIKRGHERAEKAGPSAAELGKSKIDGLHGTGRNNERDRSVKVSNTSPRKQRISGGSRETEGSPRRKQKSKRSRVNKILAEGSVYEAEGDSLERRKKVGQKVRHVESIYEDQSNREAARFEGRRGRRGYRGTLLKDEEENHVRRRNDTDDEEKTAGRGATRRTRRERDDETEGMADISKSKEVPGQRKKKANAADSERRRVSYSVDEERTFLKRDGKRKGRSTGKTEGIDSDLMKKHRGGMVSSTSMEDKSTHESGGQSKEKTSVASKKGSRRPDSSKTGDDYSKIDEARYGKRKLKVSELYDVEDDQNSIEFQLSDQRFIQQGWTVLPALKTLKKIVHYQTMPAKPHLNWFEKHKNDGVMYYDDGSSVFLNFHTDGSGEVFYPNGKVAIKLQKLENREYDMYTVFTPGGKDCMGVERESQIVAVFDTIGNGAVFDEDGATRLSYNQIGGISRDNPSGLPLIWKWDAEEKNPVLKTVYAEKSIVHLEKFLQAPTRISAKSSRTARSVTSPASSRNKDKKVVERKPVVAEHVDEEEEVESGLDLYENYPEENPHLQVICMKLTDYISLRILNRRNINLQFFAGAKNIRIELGTILDLRKKVASFFVDKDAMDVILKCKFDKLVLSDLKSDSSLYDLAVELQKIKKLAKQRKFRIKKYRPFLHAWKESKNRCEI